MTVPPPPQADQPVPARPRCALREARYATMFFCWTSLGQLYGGRAATR